MVKVVKRLIDLSPKELKENLCPHKKTSFNFCLVPSGKCPYQWGGQGKCIIPFLLFLKQDVTIEKKEVEATAVKDGIKMTDKEFQYEFLKSLENEGRTLKGYIQTLIAEKKLFEKVIYDFVKRTSILWGNHSNILENQIPEEYKITEEKEAVSKLILSIENEIKKESTKYEDLYYNISGSSAITVKDTSTYSSSVDTATLQLKTVNRDKDGLILCPKCGKSHYEIGTTYTTLVYYPTVIKDGKVISEDGNRSTTELICKECGHRFTTNSSGLSFGMNPGPIPC